MQVLPGLHACQPQPGGIVLTIGNFDGVHRGHQRILADARAAASDLGIPLTVLTFEPHPIAILRPDQSPERLITHAERLDLLDRYGVDTVIVAPSTREFFELGAAEFLDTLIAACGPRLIIEGPTFSFGRHREGSVDTLQELCAARDIEVRIVPRVRLTDLPNTPEVNSSAIRRALLSGDVSLARHMLGRPHRIVGVVGRGEGRGTPLGFPTANLEEIVQLRPEPGVYAGFAQLEDEAIMPAAVNVGLQPTFEQSTPRVEAHLLGFDGDHRGRRVGVHFIERLRGQTRFESKDALRAQIARDVEHTQAAVQQAWPHAVMPIRPL